MEIRLLTTDDAAQWLRLRLEALKGNPEAFSASLEEYQSLSINEVKRRLWSVPEAFVVGAFDEARLLGVAGFYREKGPKTCHKGRVWGVYVTPEARGRRIGRRIMEILLERGGRLAGIEQILLSVSTTQETAVKLYRSLGFKPFGCEPRALKVDGKFIDEEYMVLENHKNNHHEGH